MPTIIVTINLKVPLDIRKRTWLNLVQPA